MQTLIAFTLLYFVLALAASGAGKLIMLVIEPGEIFGSWQGVLSRLKSRRGFFAQFWYKRLGGCETCTTQQIAELTFAGLVILFIHAAGHWPTGAVKFAPAGLAWLVRAFLNAGLYILFCGMVMYFSQALSKKKIETPQDVQREYPDDEIVRNPTTKKL